MRAVLLPSLLVFAAACSGKAPAREGAPPDEATRVEEAERPADCPERSSASYPLEGVSAKMQTAAYWVERLPREEASAVLMSPEEIRVHNDALVEMEGARPAIVDLRRPFTREQALTTVSDRCAYVLGRVKTGEFRVEDPAARPNLKRAGAQLRYEPNLRVALEDISIRCAPFAGATISTVGDARFDRNCCSVARAGEPVEVIGDLGGGWSLARTGYAVGFVPVDAPLSPPLDEKERALWLEGDAVMLAEETAFGSKKNAVTLSSGAKLPLCGKDKICVAHKDGVHRRPIPKKVAVPLPRPLTRRAFLEEAFRYIGSPYGWGGQNGGRDCSRLVLDVMRAFGLELPRVSSAQSESGLYRVEVPAEATTKERLGLLDAAFARGITLIHFPGHIMIYLGRDEQGVPRALHSFAEYLLPCGKSGKDTLVETDGVAVTGLDLGKGTARRSFLERMTRLAVFGRPPGYELEAFAEYRPAASWEGEIPKNCDDSLDIALFRSPYRPVADRPVRLIVASNDDLRPARLWLKDPDGKIHAPQSRFLGVGPYAQWVELKKPASGLWHVLVADGERVLACEPLGIWRFSPKPQPEPPENPQQTASSRLADTAASSTDPVAPPSGDGIAELEEEPPGLIAWEARISWERDTENLYAAFVEQLFAEPADENKTWRSLDELLDDPRANLLHNHLGQNEDGELSLVPDCADLPFYLRAYFAYKLKLPFAFRRCSRGREDRPPACGDIVTNEEQVPGTVEEFEAVQQFITRVLKSGVHAATGRTEPRSDRADLYPVALNRRALSPGAVFVDPYGHVIVVAKWIPQGLGTQGKLLGADAQPDGTVGRRRFWQGSFLFEPETQAYGAGFKAFRPIVREKEKTARLVAPEKRPVDEQLVGTAADEVDTAPLVPLTRKEINASRDFPEWSLEQYRLGKNGFYDAMDALIYPRGLSPELKMKQLVSALDEQVKRRLVSVDNGVRAAAKRATPIDMPDDAAIFQTAGPWEDFSTPSRDMRLLIAIDTVRSLTANLRRNPTRFGVDPNKVDEAVSELQKGLDEELASRKFTYVRSDKDPYELTLRDVVERVENFEMAYNPNDCVEVRWGAAEGSKEMASCTKRAPADQREKMARYRPWFAKRSRPAED